MCKEIGLAVLILLFGAYESSAGPRDNPITSYDRLWLEWNITPNVKWAPSSVDPKAYPDSTLNVLKLQPVFSARLNEDWTILTRTICRFVSAPSASPMFGPSPFGEPFVLDWNQRNLKGLSDVSPTSFLVPNLGPDWSIGFGPSLVIPAGNGPTDSGKLSVGPALLGYYHRGPWTVGARLRNVWSVAGDPECDEVHRFIAQPLIHYQFSKKWYFTSSPIISSDWTHPDSEGWSVPVGGGLGYTFTWQSSQCSFRWRPTTTR